MKVLFTIDSLGNGGTERSLLDVIRCFGPETEVVFCYYYRNEELKPLYEQLPIRLIGLGLSGTYSFSKGIRLLKQVIQQEQPDLIVSSLYRTSIMTRIAAKWSGVRVVDTIVEESYGSNRRSVFRGWKAYKFWLPYFLDLITAWIPVAWISNSNSIARHTGKMLLIPERKIKTIYRGRDTSLIQQWMKPSADGYFHFAAIGRLYPKKGFSDLIHAIRLLVVKHPNVRVMIYGGGPQEKELVQLITEHQLQDFIQLAGNTPGAWNQLYKAHCFVFPSWYEGFSGALVEAMVMGIPIVASDIPMNLEAVEKDVTAVVFPVKDHAALAQSLEQVMVDYDRALAMGEKARQEAIQRFDLALVARQYEDFLKSLI